MPRKTQKRRLGDPHQWAADVAQATKGVPPPTGLLDAVLARQAEAKKVIAAVRTRLGKSGVVEDLKAVGRWFSRPS